MIFGHSFSQMPIAGQPPRAKNGSVSSPNIVEASPSSDRWTPRPDGGGEGGGEPLERLAHHDQPHAALGQRVAQP